MFGVHLGWADIATAAPVAERAALAAIAADSEDAWAHNAMGSVYFSTRRLDDSLAEFELALQLNPNFSLAQGYYGLALSYCGRWHDAYDATQRAIRLSPRDPSSAIYYGVAAYAQFVGKNYAEAIALTREAIRQRGDLSGAYRVLTVAAGMKDRLRWPNPRFRSYGARSPISHWPGSRPSCRGSLTPIANTTWRGSGARAWNEPRANPCAVPPTKVVHDLDQRFHFSAGGV
jgi:tetratricopeptide (TPR) repeat protein